MAATAGAAPPPSLLPDAPVASLPPHPGGTFALAFDRSGARLASGGGDAAVRVWDGRTGAPRGPGLARAVEAVTALAFTADRRALLGGCADQALRLWDCTSGRVSHTLTGHTARVTAAATAPSAPRSAASAGADRAIKLWDLGRGFCARTLLCPSTCQALAFAAGGAALLTGHYDGGVRLWDMRAGGAAVAEAPALHAPGGGVLALATSLDGGAALSLGRDGCLHALDARTLTPLPGSAPLRAPGFRVGGQWAGAALGPDGRHAAAGGADGAVFVWEVATGAVVRELRPPGSASGGPPPAIQALAWSPQGTPLAVGDRAGGVTLWAPAGERGGGEGDGRRASSAGGGGGEEGRVM